MIKTSPIQKNFNEEKVINLFGVELTMAHVSVQGVVTFTKEELQGVPEDVVSGYTKRTEGDKEVYDVTFKTPDIFPVVRTCLYNGLRTC